MARRSSIPETLPGIGSASQRVTRDGGFDPRRVSMSPMHHVLWQCIGDGTTVRELLEGAEVSLHRAIAIVRDLLRHGAIRCEPPADAEQEAADAADPVDLAKLTAREERLLGEAVELRTRQKQRILAVSRILEGGDELALLGVQPTASKRDLKRAYFELSKEFHPDRYFGRRLGSFAPLLLTIFETATRVVKTLSDVRTVTARDPSAAGPRRRASPRFPYAAEVRARCATWPEAAVLTTSDVSAGGLFVVTNAPAQAGERIAIEVALGQAGRLLLYGAVVDRRVGAGGARTGLGVRLDPMSGPERERFAQLLADARAAAPAPLSPEEEAAGGEPVRERPRLARGTGPVRQPLPIVGIDLGTSFTSVSAAIDGRVRVLRWPAVAGGQACIPSVVAFPIRGQHEVGEAARQRLARDPRHAVAAAKRLLGRQADDRELEAHLAQAGFQAAPGPDGNLVLEMWGEPYAIPQVLSYLLAAARWTAEVALERPVQHAVLTVPVSFTPAQVKLLRRAGALAGLEVVEVIDEPSGAALANRFHPDFGGRIGVFDFGGGTFDFSVVDAAAGDFQVLATAGDSWLGGDDLDYSLAEAVANKFWRVHGLDLRQRAVEWQQLLFASEQVKRVLTVLDEAELFVPAVMQTAGGPQDLRVHLRRDTVERLWRPAIERALATCAEAIMLAGVRPRQLSAIYLSGGTSYVPAVRRALQERFAVPVRTGVPPRFACCLGAGVHAAQLAACRAPTLAPR